MRNYRETLLELAQKINTDKSISKEDRTEINNLSNKLIELLLKYD